MTQQTYEGQDTPAGNAPKEDVQNVGDMKLGLGGVSTSPEPIGAGTYRVEVASVKPALGKEPPHNPYLAWQLTVVDGEKAGRKLFLNTGLTIQSRWATKRTLLALGFDPAEVDNPDLTVSEICEAAIGTEAAAVVVTRMYQGEPRDNVSKLIPADALAQLELAL